MAIYFVDGDNGDDTKDGLSLANAWKTINKACQTMAAGDTTYVKPCIYRETAEFANSGSANNYIQLIGDIDGEYWGKKGDIIICGADTDGTPTRDYGLVVADKSYMKIYNVNVEQCLTYGILLYANSAHVNYITIENCKIYQNNIGIYIVHQVEPYVCNNIEINKCLSFANQTHGFSNNGYSAANSRQFNIVFNNCIAFGNGHSGFRANYSNYKLYHCLSFGNYYGLNGTGQNASYDIVSKWSVYTANNQYGIYLDTANAFTGNYNAVYYNFTGNRNNAPDTNAFDKLCLLMTPNFVLHSNSPVIDNAIGSTITEDIFGNPRPLKSGYDIGPIEFNEEPIQESTIKESGSYSAKLIKAEFKDFTTFLSAGEHTISAKVKWSDYDGENKPQLIIKQDKYCGIDSDQIATATGDGTEWETLSKTITLSKDAEIVIRVYSRDIGANALTYFDSLNIT